MPSRSRITVTYMSGPFDGRTLTFEVPRDTTAPVEIKLGRREGNHVLLDYDSQSSREHAKLTYHPREDQFFLEDLESRNHTYIGGEELPPRLPRPIRPGDLFRIGRTWLRVDPARPSHADPTDGIPF